MMRWLGDVWFRLRSLFARGQMERDLADEFAYHVERAAEKYRAQGVDDAEARRLARVAFGGEERFKEGVRETWGSGVVFDLWSDVRFAARQFLRDPAFTAVAALTLALGIGGTVALFSVVHGLMLRPLPVANEDQIMVFWSDFNWRGVEFDAVKDVPSHFQSVAAYSNNAYTLRTEAGTSMVLATVASSELWDVLGTPPLLGRTFLPGEDRVDSEDVIVLGYGIWQREFGGDPDVVGRRIDFGGASRTVVGVMPKDFYFPSPAMEVFIPLRLDPAQADYSTNGWLVLAGRLRPGTGPAQIEDDLRAVTNVLGEHFQYTTRWDKTRNPFVVPLRQYVLGDARPSLLLLLGAVGMILLMACVNVAALILTRTVDRIGEMSVRAALGAGRARLARQVVTESLVLGLAAGLIGTALAKASFQVLVAGLPVAPDFKATLQIEGPALLAGFALSILAGTAVSLAAIRNLLHGDLSQGELGQRGDGRTRRAGRTHQALVVAEVVLAVVLVTGASLLVRTVDQLRAIDPGFDPAGVLTADVIMATQSATGAERAQFFDALQERVGALPGVVAVGFTNRLPLRDGGYQGSVTISDRPDLDAANRPNAMFRPMSPGAFAALGVEMVRGRAIRPTDGPDAPLVAVVNESFARRIWGDENPIGRTYTTGFVGTVEVVGVVKNVATTDLVGEQPMTGYYSWDQSLRGSAYGILVAKTTGDPSDLVAPLRSIMKELEPGAALGRVETMEEALDAEIAEPLRLRFFLGLFSVLGIVLGTVGVYGVVSYSIQRRRAEFGIRVALGATQVSLLGAVVRQGMLPVAVGVLGGTVASLLSTRALAAFLFRVEPTDPASLAAAGGLLLLAGAAGGLIPAIRASATRPAAALRSE